MTGEDNELMDAVFGRIRACVPEMHAEGHFYEEAQLIKVEEERKEAFAAWEKWMDSGSRKDEVDYLEEVVDTMMALATLLWAHARDASPSHRCAAEVIEKVMDMVNLKNELRGYHDFEEEGEKSEEESRA